jgi:hypothetical protein
MIIIRRLLVLILITICCGIIANADDNKSYKCEGNTYSSTGRQCASSTSQATPYFWTDSKGNKYHIYISASGSFYIIKKSNKTGKDYKQYMKPEISQDICSKLGKEYKGKKK